MGKRDRITLDLYRKCPGLLLPLLPGFFCRGTSDRDLALHIQVSDPIVPRYIEIAPLGARPKSEPVSVRFRSWRECLG